MFTKNTYKIKYTILIVLLMATQIDLFSQIRGQMWKKFQHEIFITGGATNYLGDLGGGPESGTKGLSHLNPAATKFMGGFGYKYKITSHLTFRGEFAIGQASGADSLTENLGRKTRNLSFKTTFFTLSPIFEVYMVPEQFGRSANPFSMYAASGLRFMYFNPQAELNGTWYDLQPLGTEGQLLAGKSPYSQFTIVLPFIIGTKFKLPSARGGKAGAITIGIEASANWLMTDYFDDVSTKYANPEAIRQTSGNIGVELADRRLSPSKGTEGGIRGNPTQNDWYGTFQVTIGKQLYSKTRRRRPSSRNTYY